MLALVSNPPRKTPSASPPTSTSLSSGCPSAMLASNPSGSRPAPPCRCRATRSIRNWRGRGRGAEGAGAAVAEVEARGPEGAERRAVDLGQPEQVADHPERYGEGQPVDQVDDRARGLHVVEAVGHDPVDALLEASESPPGELGHQHVPQPGVVRGVGHPQPADLLGRGARAGAEQVAHVVAEPVPSARTVRARSWPVTSQTSRPRTRMSRVTSPRARAAASSGTGSTPSRRRGSRARAGKRLIVETSSPPPGVPSRRDVASRSATRRTPEGMRIEAMGQADRSSGTG